MFLDKLVVATATCVALIAFFQGFLPQKPQINGYATDKCCSRPIFSKVVLLVVDALKTNFVVHDRANNWPYLDRLISERHARVYNARVHPPTVTLPRIKVNYI